VAGGLAGRDDRAMPQESGEVEITISDALEPVTNALAGDASALGCRGQRGAGPHAVKRAEDVRHAIGLAGQRIGGENPFAFLARGTPSEDNQKLAMPARLLESAGHPRVGELEVGAGAVRADAARKNGVTASRDDLGILGSVCGEYVRQHVPRRPRFS